MLTDHWGYELTTTEPAAAAALNRVFASYIGFRTDLMSHLETAIDADPDFALARAIRGILIVSLRKPELYPAAQAELTAARAGRAPTSAREKLYLKALEAALQDRITAATACYEEIVTTHPLELFAMRLAQSELFWIGEVAWMRDISERAAAHWKGDTPLYSGYLSIRSFGLEENGAYEQAEKCGREAVERDPADMWGTHAVAHVLVMQGRLRDGIAWLDGLCNNWTQANHIVHHVWWHLALFYTEAGDYDGALDTYDRRLRNLDSPLMQAMPDFFVDIQNDAALLQRLELRGIDVGERWQPIADLAAARSGNHSSPFTSAHCALALAAAGRFDEAETLAERMREFIASNDDALGPRYALAVLPASLASIAFRRGDYRRVIDLLMPARHNLWQMGGSHAQRDLFFQLLIDAASKLERRDLLAVLLDDLHTIGFERIAERSSYGDAATLLGANGPNR